MIRAYNFLWGGHRLSVKTQSRFIIVKIGVAYLASRGSHSNRDWSEVSQMAYMGRAAIKQQIQKSLLCNVIDSRSSHDAAADA